MASLRQALGIEFASTLATSFAEIGKMSKLREGKVFNFAPHCLSSVDTNYRGHCMEYWCVPCGTTQLTFELWGGGGSGAGSCCCQQGVPGGSGAYARKTLTTCDLGQDMGGWCFFLAPGRVTDCAPCCHGYQGCKTWVCGKNSEAQTAIGSNFCAEGGAPGKSCCSAYWSEDYNCQDRVDFGGGPSDGSFRDGTMGTTAGLGGWNRTNDCSCYFGADAGVAGRPGFFRIYNTTDNCWARQMLPYPAKFIDDMGGHITTQQMGNACNNEWRACMAGTSFVNDTHCGSFMMPGTGQPTATSCGGSCCYGWKGSSGFIKITYCSCWVGVNKDCAFHFCN